jgi:cyanophycin synthetase
MSNVWETPAPAEQFFFRFTASWKRLRGMAFGLREPTILGHVHLNVPERLDFPALDDWMARYLPAQPSEDNGDESTAMRLVRRVLFWAGTLERRAGLPVFGEAYVHPHGTGDDGEAFRFAVPYYSSRATTEALTHVGATINAFLARGRTDGEPEEAKRRWNDVDAVLNKLKPEGVNTYRVLAAAHNGGIPVGHIMGGIFAFGMGSNTRWLQSTFTDRTPLLASRLAANKLLTAQLLRKAGLPAPTHAPARSAEEAVQIAKRLGYPVVVKPADLQQGRGVAANLKSDVEVTAAYGEAAKLSKKILVEKHFDGTDYRMTVLDGKLFRVSARLPGGVIGDGNSTVSQLVEAQHQSERFQRRARERGHPLIELDGEALRLLAEAGLSPDTVLPEGQYQRLRRRGNVSAGGTSKTLAVEAVHPENIRLAERAVAALGLDVGGVDVILPDGARSWMETGAIICEVNAQPQIGSSAMPEFLETFLKGSDGRIPVLVIIGSGATIDWPRLAAGELRARTGFASNGGVWLGRERLAGAQPSGFEAGQMLVGNRQVEAAIMVIGPGEALGLGLPVDRCDLLVIEAPDAWPSAERAMISEVLRAVLPHAGKAIYLDPAKSLPVSDCLEPAGANTLQQVCERFIAGLATGHPPAE